MIGIRVELQPGQEFSLNIKALGSRFPEAKKIALPPNPAVIPWLRQDVVEHAQVLWDSMSKRLEDLDALNEIPFSRIYQRIIHEGWTDQDVTYTVASVLRASRAPQVLKQNYINYSANKYLPLAA